MLTVEDNELLTRTGPGTPMGDLFRRFWMPVALTRELIKQRSAPFEPARFKDDYEAGLRALIQAKLRGRQAAPKPAPAPPAEVIDLMQALKRSLDTMASETANATQPKTRHRRARPARGA